MADMSSDNVFSRSARGVVHQLGEIIHVCAIYLGIAVLVTVMSSLTVPSLREQSRQMHTALLATLRPDALDYARGPALARADMFPDAGALASAPERPDGQGIRGVAQGGVPPGSPAAAGYFSGALGDAPESLSVPGITSAQAQALRSYISRKYKIAHNVAAALIKIVFAVGREKQMDPQLLLAVIAIESRYNPFAESHVGAQGLMQVMTKVHKEKFEAFGGDAVAALNPVANIRVGSQILSDCIKRRGSIEAGLACYVGAVGPSDGGYGDKVLAERRRIALASGIPVARN